MKSELTEIQINGVDYVRKDGIPKPDLKGDIKIVVLQRGWNLVGRFEREGADCTLHNASVIRYWGTTQGLGEIAQNGPTEKTKMDKCFGEVKFDILTVVFTLDCKEEAWKSAL